MHQSSKSRDQVLEAIKEECQILQKLVKAKNTLEWMQENKFLIPEKLMNDIHHYESQARFASQKTQESIDHFDAQKNRQT